jgi:hypothetical protein
VQRHVTMHSLIYGLIKVCKADPKFVGTLRIRETDYKISVSKATWVSIEKTPGGKVGSFDRFQDVVGCLVFLATPKEALREADQTSQAGAEN